MQPFAVFRPLGLTAALTLARDPKITAVVLSSDGCYVEFLGGCLLAVRAPISETTLEEIPDYV